MRQYASLHAATRASKDERGAVTSPSLLQIARDDPAAIRAELLAGLTAPTATIAPKYLYDALGSRLFAAITELPEYYPTRTEAAIFAEHAGQHGRGARPGGDAG